jgi:hypothetical protein
MLTRRTLLKSILAIPAAMLGLSPSKPVYALSAAAVHDVPIGIPYWLVKDSRGKLGQPELDWIRCGYRYDDQNITFFREPLRLTSAAQ